MLTFKQSVLLLVSIITILAIIALGTGLSPLYWPMPKDFTRESKASFRLFDVSDRNFDEMCLDHSSVVIGAKTISTSTVKTSVITRLKPIPKKYDQLATIQLVTDLPKIPQFNAVTNDTLIQNMSNV